MGLSKRDRQAKKLRKARRKADKKRRRVHRKKYKKDLRKSARKGMSYTQYKQYQARKKKRRQRTGKIIGNAAGGVLKAVAKAPDVIDAATGVVKGAGNVLSGGFGGPVVIAALGAGALLLLRR